MDGQPPPPPPHGTNPGSTGDASGNGGRYRSSTDLPEGPYDIFIIPPHSSGSGFLYLPSLQCHRNSFLAGVAATLVAVAFYVHLLPVVKSWVSSIAANGGMGVFMLVVGVAVAGWAIGKTQSEAGGTGSGSSRPGTTGGGANTSNFGGHRSSAGFGGSANGSPNNGPQYPGGQHADGQQPGGQHYYNTQPGSSTAAGAGAGASEKQRGEWDKAREETQRKEEIKRKMEEFRKKKKEEEQRKKEQEEKEAREQQQKREKEAREREFREWKENRAKEKAQKEAADKAAADKAAQEKAAQEKSRMGTPSSAQQPSPQKKPPFATVKTATEDDAYSFRPYDRPRPSAIKTNPAPSIFSESSYAASQSTARTTPPPSRRGPYTTKDPDKVIIHGVYSFNNTYMRVPVAQLVSGQGHVTDGLIMRITTEGMFVDDDVRGIAQREWDIKAWTLKVVETAVLRSYHVVRASLRDQEGKKYVFVLQESEGWKVSAGLQKLRKGSQARALVVCGLPANETTAILGNLGY